MKVLLTILRGGGAVIAAAAPRVLGQRHALDRYRAVDARQHGRAADFVRVFPVPGMNHCGGGPATDRFDAFAALTAWVEKRTPPDRILATAGPQSPWPGRTRPLCPYPKIARYTGGNREQAAAFACR